MGVVVILKRRSEFPHCRSHFWEGKGEESELRNGNVPTEERVGKNLEVKVYLEALRSNRHRFVQQEDSSRRRGWRRKRDRS